MRLECFWNDFVVFETSSSVESCPTSLPGGDQVDGLPPAASNTKYSCLETPGRTVLFMIFGRFFEKSWIFHAETYIFGILYVLNILMLKRMPKGLLLYRLLDRVWHKNWLTSRGLKNDENVKKYEVFRINKKYF